MGNVFQRLLNILFTKKLEVVLVGLENRFDSASILHLSGLIPLVHSYSGKTTLLQVLSDGTPAETAPTIGLNVKMVKRGGVQMKCWDLGGELIPNTSCRSVMQMSYRPINISCRMGKIHAWMQCYYFCCRCARHGYFTGRENRAPQTPGR